MAEMITFKRPDGQDCPAYFSAPTITNAPGVVVIQEWWGLNEQIKNTADRIAAAGYRALVPDLYRGKIAATGDEANHMMNGLNWGDAAMQDVAGALRHLKQTGAKAGVMGFCMGGALTVLASANLEDADAAVCFYGIPPAEAADPKKISVPFMAHFATVDDWCTPDVVAAFEKQLEAGGVNFILHRYEGQQHAFMNDARPEVYDEASAKLAFERTLEFLGSNLAS